MYMKESRSLLRKVKNQRLWCLKHSKSYIDPTWAKNEIKNIEAALSTIKTTSQMKSYLIRKQPVIDSLMPGKNSKNHKKLQKLINLPC